VGSEDLLVLSSGSREGAAQAGGGAPASASATAARPARARAPRGTFRGKEDARRKIVEEPIKVIELAGEEPLACSAAAGPGLLAACTGRFLCKAHGGSHCRHWRIRGPVIGWSDDAQHLTTITVVRAMAELPPHEVYVRSVPLLVPQPYASAPASYHSVRLVAGAVKDVVQWESASSFSGFAAGQVLSNNDIKSVIKKASKTMGKRRRKVANGLVALMERTTALSDPVYKDAVRAVSRRRSAKAAHHFRQKGQMNLAKKWGKVIAGWSPAAVARIRRLLEFDEPADDGGRARRQRVSHGLSQMHLLPTAKQMQSGRRAAPDEPGRTAHYLFTKSATGELTKWHYILGSRSNGIRRYRCAKGLSMRLRTHTNKFWDARRKLQEDDDSEDEDDGIFFKNANAEYDGLYSPQETDPVRIEELKVHSESFLEFDDGTGELKVLAIGYDIKAEIQKAIDNDYLPALSAADVAVADPAVLTFASDGGTVRRKQITAFTLALSSPCMTMGRTDLSPIMYVFSGEKAVDKALSAYVRDTLADALSGGFTVPLSVPDVAAGDVSEEQSESDAPTAQLLLDPVLQVCGTLK